MHNPRLARTGLALLLIVTLAACQTVGKAADDVVDATQSMFSDDADPTINAVILAAARQQDTDPEDLAETEAAARLTADDIACDPSRVRPDGNFEDGLHRLRERGFGHWPLPAIEAYLSGILDRIAACAPFEPQAAKVVVVPNGAINATTYPDGLIAVTLGLVQAMPGDDAIAFVLAHEYGHILLRHYERSASTDQRARIVSTITEAAFLGDELLSRSGNAPRLTDKLKNPTLAGKTMDLLFEHAWGREDEHEADMIGLHLSILAGYNGRTGSVQFIDALARQPSLAERMQTLAADKQKVFGAMAEGAVTDGKSGVMDALGDLGTDMAQRVIAGLERSHPDPEDRKAVLIEYQQHHKILPLFLKRRTLNIASMFAGDTLEAVQRDRAFSAAAAAFENASTVRDALSSGGSLAEIEKAGYSENQLIAAAKKGVSGPMPWFERNAYGRLVFSALRRIQGKNDFAKIGYERYALAEPDEAPLRVFENLLDLQILEEDTKSAQGTLNRAAEVYGLENVNLYMMRIKLAQAKGEDPTSLLTACRLSGDPAIAAGCRYWAWDNTGASS